MRWEHQCTDEKERLQKIYRFFSGVWKHPPCVHTLLHSTHLASLHFKAAAYNSGTSTAAGATNLVCMNRTKQTAHICMLQLLANAKHCQHAIWLKSWKHDQISKNSDEAVEGGLFYTETLWKVCLQSTEEGKKLVFSMGSWLKWPQWVILKSFRKSDICCFPLLCPFWKPLTSIYFFEMY